MDDSQNTQAYPTSRLDRNLSQIRLLSLLPGRWSDPISCELTLASLDNLPSYYALSYVWGDRTNLRQIRLNGTPFSVTCNLESALRRLRHQSQIQRLWIDMLCIDQSSTEERSHQVNLMHKIYSMAQEAFLWLGDYIETAHRGDILSLTSQTTNDSVSENDSKYTRELMATQNLSRSEALNLQSFIKRLSCSQHLGFLSNDTLDVDLNVLDKFMDNPW
jgi:Heterokaryon incompatibility protein (HET)